MRFLKAAEKEPEMVYSSPRAAGEAIRLLAASSSAGRLDRSRNDPHIPIY